MLYLGIVIAVPDRDIDRDNGLIPADDNNFGDANYLRATVLVLYNI